MYVGPDWMKFTLTKKRGDVKVLWLQEIFLSSFLRYHLFSYLDSLKTLTTKNVTKWFLEKPPNYALTQFPVIRPHILFPLFQAKILSRILSYLCMYSLITICFTQVECKPHEQTDPIILVTYIPSVFSANYWRLFAKWWYSSTCPSHGLDKSMSKCPSLHRL